AQTARALLARAEAGAASGSVRLADILSLRGRLWEDVVHREAGGSAATEAAQRAREQYLQAHAIARDPYPGINAATLSLLLDERDVAVALARRSAERRVGEECR